MESRQLVSLQHMLEGKKKKKQPFQHFSRLASGWYPQLNACYAQTHRQTKKLQSMYCRRSRRLTHNMGKSANKTNTPYILFGVFLFVDSQTGEPVVDGRLPRQDAGKICKKSSSCSSEIPHTHWKVLRSHGTLSKNIKTWTIFTGE